jgi:hypothetical protein
MEEAYDLAGPRINARYIRSFGTIALDASKGKVIHYSCSAVLKRDNVIDLEGRRM